jgi:polar amino acid transport system substrate-binding protein
VDAAAPASKAAIPAPPMPGNSGTAAAASAEPAGNCGDPTASLRPVGDVTHGPAVDAIRARGYLIVGLDTGNNLLGFLDPLTGVIEGFDADIAKEVARDLFGNPDLVQYRMISDADRESALQQHRVDIVAKTMTINCERRQKVSFSTEYFEAHQRVLVMAPDTGNGLATDIPRIGDIADLASRKVCAVEGSTSLANIRRLVPTATVVTVPTWADCLVVLQQREVDAVSTDDTVLAGLAAQDPRLAIVGPPLTVEPYGIGIAGDQPDLVRFVNRTLARVRSDGTWDRTYRRWLLTILGPVPGPPAPHYQD